MCKGAARKLDAASETKHLMEAEYEIAYLSVPWLWRNSFKAPRHGRLDTKRYARCYMGASEYEGSGTLS